MTINKVQEGNTLTIEVGGRLDTTTAPELERVLKDSYDGIITMILDMKELVYLSSAGLRTILVAQKQMNKQGNLIVRHVNDTIMEVFEVTGFNDILDIE